MAGKTPLFSNKGFCAHMWVSASCMEDHVPAWEVACTSPAPPSAAVVLRVASYDIQCKLEQIINHKFLCANLIFCIVHGSPMHGSPMHGSKFHACFGRCINKQLPGKSSSVTCFSRRTYTRNKLCTGHRESPGAAMLSRTQDLTEGVSACLCTHMQFVQCRVL